MCGAGKRHVGVGDGESRERRTPVIYIDAYFVFKLLTFATGSTGTVPVIEKEHYK